jgi:hypothetical protein
MMHTCTGCGCVIGDGGDLDHTEWHRRIDLLSEQVQITTEVVAEMLDPEPPEVETIDTKGRT